MITSRASLSLFFLLVSLGMIQIEGRRLNGMRTKRSAENFGLSAAPCDDSLNLCSEIPIDAAFYFTNEILYVFKGNYFWEVVDNKVRRGYPKLVNETWPGLPSKIDTAFSPKSSEVIFFSGTEYWKYTNNKLEPGYPKRISDGFPGIPDNIQAVTVWEQNKLIYFFKDDQYWRYEPACVPQVRSTYPKYIRDGWADEIPSNLDAVLVHTSQYKYAPDVTYFFKRTKFWVFENKNSKVDSYYPQAIVSQWFDCKRLP